MSVSIEALTGQGWGSSAAPCFFPPKSREGHAMMTSPPASRGKFHPSFPDAPANRIMTVLENYLLEVACGLLARIIHEDC